MPCTKFDADTWFVWIERSTGVTFVDRNLLLEAMTHASFLNEHDGHPVGSGERLALLGSSVLELVITECLVGEIAKIGEISKRRAVLASAQMMSMLGSELGLAKFVLVSRGMERDANSHSSGAFLSGLVRAFVGALFRDKGLEACREFVSNHILARGSEIVESLPDHKSRLQELTEEMFGVLPSYRVVETRGLVHEPTYIVEVLVGDRVWGKGEARSTKQAEHAAAGNAIASIQGQTSPGGRLRRRIAVG